MGGGSTGSDGVKLGPLQHMLAGAMSGAFADTLTHPLSTIKTRLQVQGAGSAASTASTSTSSISTTVTRYSGSFSAFRSVLAEEGPVALYRGLGAVLLGAAPATGLYFVGFESVKRLAPHNPIAVFAAGSFAQICGSLAWVPMDVVKERLQVEGQLKVTSTYSGSIRAIRGIVSTEGVAGLYRAYWMHQATWVPFNGIYMLTYEQCKTLTNADGNPTKSLACGMAAGAVAASSTAPIDLVKTRLQVQRSNPAVFDYNGALDATRKILQREGAAALFDGVGARVMWLMPRMTAAVSAYEFFSRQIAKEAAE